jgi:anti-sigma B factor antagonist
VTAMTELTTSPESGTMRADELITTSVEHRRQGVVVLVVRGEIDACTAPRLDTAIRQALAEMPAVLVLDFAGVEFFTAAGLRVLLQAKDRGSSAHVVLVCSGGVVNHLIQLTGLDATFLVYRTVNDALASMATNLQSHG